MGQGLHHQVNLAESSVRLERPTRCPSSGTCGDLKSSASAAPRAFQNHVQPGDDQLPDHPP